ncbi:beta-glucosidase family protein [Allosphingosinicella deserti]|uniref:Glycosyl hydrolase n=1 Tax=Allosphingosinicella deserti TaxID=2116704 RepID=A0A2P7QKC9_9SPHN|nr:glycoside hydrolase family 3 C-terminal domain-containing protein [Sphingomonas deserti]PSJ38439.1 glycosyl hydrolase [Sphingomonas deserti]
MKKSVIAFALAASMLALSTSATGLAAPAANRPWMNTALTPEQRTEAVLAKMTREEKLRLVFGYFGTDFEPKKYKAPKEVRYGSAGYVPGIPRLGIPPQWQTDAGIGVATQGSAPTKRERTALPSGMATAATWNPDLAFQGGAMIGREARQSGFNVMLAGGVNLVRDPRNGRNFEYGGEDPLLAGIMVGAQIAGIQSNNIISTVKHYAINDLETGRDYHDARIDPTAARMSDLLAFQIAIEKSDPGSVMCAYNRVNGLYACENPWLLTDVLRNDWGWKGFVMSDWGATHSTVQAANTGLDQQSGHPFDKAPYFDKPLRDAVRNGEVSERRLTEMAGRILYAMFDNGVVDHPVKEEPIDLAAHAAVTRADAEQGAVLLKNGGRILPLKADTKKIVVIGGYADRGVLSGGGSSQTYPAGGNAVPDLEPKTWPGPVVYYPNAPLAAIRAQAPNAQVTFVDGRDPAAAARAAAEADVALVFVTQWASESIDASMTLPDNQDALVSAVAAANPKTVAILETGGPVLMPWADRVAGILEAWYPGTAGGDAIANLLFGKVNPSGKLPVTFPRDETQLPRQVRPGTGLAQNEMFAIDYSEGAAIGYKWFDKNGLEPLFPFGHGLSYTDFDYGRLQADAASGDLTVSFRVKNDGKRQGMDVPQLYVAPVAGGWEAPQRLAGFKKVDLAPGADTMVSVSVDPRLLATWDEAGKQWKIAGGQYKVMLGTSSRDVKETVTVQIPERILPASWRPAA